MSEAVLPFPDWRFFADQPTGDRSGIRGVQSPKTGAGCSRYGAAANHLANRGKCVHNHGINAGIPAYEEALKADSIDYQIFVYDGANHAFNNDTSEARYNKEAADLAWSRTVEFLKGALS